MRYEIPIFERGLIAGVLQLFRSVDRTRASWHYLGSWRRSFGQKVGQLDPTLHYTMDYDLWLRMGRLCDPLINDALLASFRLHATSKSGRVCREQFDEQYRVALRYLSNDRASRVLHRFNVEKTVWAYRMMKLLGM